MRILHIIDSLDLGGAERMAVELANVALSFGHETGVLVTRRFGPMEKELAIGVPRWSLGRTKRWQFKLRSLKKIFITFEPDLLHVHGRSSMTFVAACKVLTRIQIPAVFHDHYGRIAIDNTPKRLHPVAVGWACARYVGVSKEIADWAVASGLAPSKVAVIGNALDLDRFRRLPPVAIDNELGTSPGRPVGVVVAGIRPEKGILQLIRAAALLPRRASWSFVVVGGGLQTPYGELCQAEVRRYNLTDRFHFFGPRPDAVGVAKACDFAVIPSIFESGPLVLIEYVACKLPVIASATGDVVDRAEQMQAVRTVPPEDVAALARAMDEVIHMSEGERQSLGKRAHERTQELFDLRRMFGEWQTVYRQACGRSEGCE